MRVGVVLAGGKSSRMGRNKAELSWQNMPLWQWQTRTLLQICDKVRISGFDLADRFVDKGPLAALDAVITAEPDATELLLLPVDMPCVDADDLQQLILQQTSCSFAQTPIPMYLPVSDQLRAEVAARIHDSCSKARSMFALLTALGGRQISIAAYKLSNANTPSDYQFLTENYHGTFSS